MWLTKAHTSQEAPTSISGSSSLMAYRLKAVTIRTNNSEEGIRKIAEFSKDGKAHCYLYIAVK